MNTTLGQLDVLNCGTGHLSFKFDKNDAAEVEKARKVIQDMLRRGYMLFVEDGKEQKRVRKFDENTDEYILEEPDPEVAKVLDQAAPPPSGRRVPIRRGRATAVGPSAGG